MTASNPILEYSADRPQSRTLTFESTDSAIRVIFPVSPKWSYWLPVIFGAALGLFHIALGLTMATAMYRISSAFNTTGPNPEFVRFCHRYALEFIVSGSISAIFWWTIGAYALWKYRRWGRVPRILTATRESLIYSKLGFRAMRQQVWPVADIKEIRFRPIKRNLNRGKTAADLQIYRRNKRRPKQFRLSSPDPELPTLIAKELAAMLGHPLT